MFVVVCQRGKERSCRPFTPLIRSPDSSGRRRPRFSGSDTLPVRLIVLSPCAEVLLPVFLSMISLGAQIHGFLEPYFYRQISPLVQIVLDVLDVRLKPDGEFLARVLGRGSILVVAPRIFSTRGFAVSRRPFAPRTPSTVRSPAQRSFYSTIRLVVHLDAAFGTVRVPWSFTLF